MIYGIWKCSCQTLKVLFFEHVFLDILMVHDRVDFIFIIFAHVYVYRSSVKLLCAFSRRPLKNRE